jgi:hypothetical protein
MKRPRVFALLCTALSALTAYGEEQHSHPVPEKLGKVSFATSCVPSVQDGFERGVALLHSFTYAPAEEAFQGVAEADPHCAMAHWGIAMSYFHQLWAPPDNDALRRGEAEITTASQLGGGTPREREFISAAATYYHGWEHLPHPVRAKAYEQSMAAVARANPRDDEAQIFYALALIATAPGTDHNHTNQKRAADILEPRYRRLPDHPGLAHYLIHAYDSSELASRGLAAARAYSKIAPSAPHALHMPSHIFTRLGYWDDSIDANIAARAAAHAQGDVSEELHAMDYLTYAYIQRGREADAQRVVDDLHDMTGPSVTEFMASYPAVAMPVRVAMEGHHWPSAAALQPSPDSSPEVAALVYWARGVAQARSGHPQLTDSEVARLTTCLDQLRSSGSPYWATQVKVLRTEVEAWRLMSEGKAAEAAQRLRSAADEEDSVEKRPITPGPIVPAREQLGEMLLQSSQPQDALREFQAALAAAPGRRGAIAGAAVAAARRPG